MTFKTKLTATISSLALVLGTAGFAVAQDTAPVEPPAESEAVEAPVELEAPAAVATDFSEAQIQAFAAAYVEVMEIGMGFEAQMAEAATDDERMSLQFEAQQQMVAAVEQLDGITVDEYNALLSAAQTDPALAEQVQGEVDALLGQ